MCEHKNKRQQRKLEREEEGSSSHCPELSAFVLALCNALVTKPILLALCDTPGFFTLALGMRYCEKTNCCWRLWKEAKKQFQWEHQTRHSRKQGFSGKVFKTGLHDRIKQVVLTWPEPRWMARWAMEIERTTCNSRVQKVIRRGWVEAKMPKHRDGVTRAWEKLAHQDN